MTRPAATLRGPEQRNPSTMKFIKRPVEIEAMRLGWDTWNEVCSFVGVGDGPDQPRGRYVRQVAGDGHERTVRVADEPFEGSVLGLELPPAVTLHSSPLIVLEGEWVVRGVQGEFYPCRADIFEESYAPAPERPQLKNTCVHCGTSWTAPVAACPTCPPTTAALGGLTAAQVTGLERLTAAATITVPRPHVLYGPEGMPVDQADARYLRDAARNVEHARCLGSNLTATVTKLLNDAADALDGRSDG
ncbi:hypothetical protein QWY28_17470 [Nocardioides sp. SOB77]|uniref:Uncharacterized protein n=1 Tax=Nocardioides oceani TaxID=3058369 RepID=A0ABT8FJS8_9ACTN|nr:hypothetical protein [Nocardioides oceani]MDN4174755.1 hypothetical protein [Nocardioides oceani]